MYYYYLSIIISLLLFIPQEFINLYSYQQLISQSYSQSAALTHALPQGHIHHAI